MEALINVLGTFLTIYTICLFAWVVLSWLPMISPQLAYNSTVVTIRGFLDSVILPYIRLFRFIPPLRVGGMLLDMSALAAILVLAYGGPLILNLLHDAFVGA